MPLADFQYVWNSPNGRVPTEWPVMFLLSCATKIEQDEDDIKLEQVHELLWEIQIVGPEETQLRTDIFRYVRAVDAIIRSMTSAELAAGLSTTEYYGALIRKIDHAYDVTRITDTGYIQRAHLAVEVEITEVG